MSNAMTEDEVREKFSDDFDRAYEAIENNDKHELIMMALQSLAESKEDFKLFMEDIKRDALPSSNEQSNVEDDKERLIDMILEEFGELHPDELDGLVGAVAQRFLDNPPRRKCNHDQLYAHATIDVVLPIEHNSAAEMTRVLDRISSVLLKTELNNYVVRPKIEIDTTKDVSGRSPLARLLMG